MAEIDDMILELRQKGNELRVKVHLASKEAQEKLEGLEKKMDHLACGARKLAEDAKLNETGKGIGDALVHLRQELGLGYERVRGAAK
ncbi:MAG: hypothetical protein VX236_05640 [Pseudomonadota bacterium]|nr:hypothetical protein [Pseudomonadota bacterium]